MSQMQELESTGKDKYQPFNININLNIGAYNPAEEDWENYEQRFELELQVAGITDEEFKRDIFLTRVGPQPFKILVEHFRSLKVNEQSYEELVDALKTYYKRKYCPLGERVAFSQRFREEDETIEHYVATLKKQADKCCFGVSLEDRLRDQLVLGIGNCFWQEELLRLHPHILATFQDVEASALELEKNDQLGHRNHSNSRISSRNSFPLYQELIRSRPENDNTKTEDLLFDMFKDPDTGLIHVGKFLSALWTTGLRKGDPRLSGLMDNLRKVHRQLGKEGGSPETQKLDRDTFNSVISANLVLITKAFRHDFIIPDFTDFTKDMEEFYWKCKSNIEGKPATYIPQLARANPDHWAVSVCTIDGQRFSIGDVKVPFTLQSCSKPLTYGIALNELGQDLVHNYVGQEPSGRNFNELVLDHNKKPHNPMINAGAILVCSLLKTLVQPELTHAEKFDYIMDYFKRLSGGEMLGFNNAVFLSEREAADRNYALGFYMREHKCYPDKTNLKECMDFYFQCCSMESNCEGMSVMAATLANGGICPVTEEKVLKPESIRDVLSLMHSCGMYDYSGQFAFKVGLPAKSGVSGALLIVIPNVMGICCWSPPLDPLGNSCRGVQFCEELVKVFNFHRYDNLKHANNKKDPRKHKYETKGLTILNLLFSAASGDLAALKRHKLSGMDMTLSDYDGRTAMHLAASEGHLECVSFLLEQCVVPYNNKDRWGNTPLDEAKTFGRVQVVSYLEDWAKNNPQEDSSPAPPPGTASHRQSIDKTNILP